MGFTPFHTPTFNIKYTFKNGLYVIADVARSNDPAGLEKTIRRDQAGFRLFTHGDGALYMPEIGYKKAAAPGVKEVWFRATGFYNATRYQDYSSVQAVVNGTKARNGAGSVVFEHQITQPDKYLAYRGLYWTATAQAALPDVDVYQGYYQLALYSIGLLHSRPLDIMILNVNRTQFSRTVLNTFQQLPHSYGAQLGVPTYDDSTAISGTYGYHLRPGTVLSGLVSYAKHPTFAPRLSNPVTGVVSLMFFY
jgi:porin